MSQGVYHSCQESYTAECASPKDLASLEYKSRLSSALSSLPSAFQIHHSCCSFHSPAPQLTIPLLTAFQGASQLKFSSNLLPPFLALKNVSSLLQAKALLSSDPAKTPPILDRVTSAILSEPWLPTSTLLRTRLSEMERPMRRRAMPRNLQGRSRSTCRIRKAVRLWLTTRAVSQLRFV